MNDIINIIKSKCVISKTPVKGPSYILPDGEFVDLYNSHMSTHGALEEWLYENNYITSLPEASFTLIKLGAIRVNDGSNFFGESIIDLPEHITKDQIYSLEEYLNHLKFVKIWVDVGSDILKIPPKTFMFEDSSINYILGYIKKLFL